MGISSPPRYLTPLIHVLLWGLLGLMLLLFQLSWHVTLPTEFWVKQLVLFGLWVMVFYLNSQVAVPRLLLQGRTGWFIASLLLLVVAVVVINRCVENGLALSERMAQAFQQDGHPARRPPGPRFDMGSLLVTLLVLGISTSITMVQKWQNDAQLRQQLEQQQTTSELSFLRAQINPHFFFNTLNNIYALTIVNGELARQALHTLSRMMRYVLYDTQTGATLLSQEIVFVEDYIELMQLRLTDKVSVTFERPVPLHDVPVAPMLLLPFIENAFKHGVSAVLPSQIHIRLSQQANTLALDVRNTLFADKRTVLEDSSGIGLVNTRRRLDLLYPGQYELAVTEHPAAQEYRVHLTLQVA